MSNQNPKQRARDYILTTCGWLIQDKNRINLHAGIEVVICGYLADAGVTDYVLFVDGKPVGIIEAKREEEGHRLTVHEAQSEEYASAKLKYLNNEKLLFVYESTGAVTRFTDFRDPKPRSRPVFSFHRPGTLPERQKKSKSLRGNLLDLPALPVERLRDWPSTILKISFKDNSDSYCHGFRKNLYCH